MKVLDLSHNLESNMPVFPGTEGPVLNNICTMEKHGFREKLITMYSHTGTHMDAPSHMLYDGKNLDDFDISHFLGPCLVIDCSSLSRDITLEHIKKYDLKNIDFLLLRTGWDKYWGQEQYFSDFPALTLEAAEYLARQSLKGIGVDCISVDLMENSDFQVHKTLLKEDMIMIENLKALDQIEDNMILQAMPLKIKQADGSPIRAIAIKSLV